MIHLDKAGRGELFNGHYVLINNDVNTVPSITSDAALNFAEKHLKGIQLVIIATENKLLNVEIKVLAKDKGILANVADTPEECDFYLGSIVTKGDLKIAISTNGKSPTFAKRFRQILEDILPEETQELISNLKQIREDLKGNFFDKVKSLNEITESMVKKGK